MKKILFLFALIGALFASCSENEINDPNVIANDDGAITFRTLRDKNVTRAANDNESPYMVYARLANGSDWFIPGITVNETGTYTSAYYWPGKSTVVDFYSYAPATGDGVALGDASATGGTDGVATLPITFTVPTTANIDFTVATPVSKSQSQVTDNVVPLEFKHMLSKVVISAKLSTDLTGSGYALSTGYTATLGVGNSIGTVDAASATAALTPASTKTSASYAGYLTYYILPQVYVANTTNWNTSQGTTEDPATHNGDCYVTLTNVTITNNGTTIFPTTSGSTGGTLKAYYLEKDDISSETFIAGTQYNFVITITDLAYDSGGEPVFNGKIEFSSTTATWGDAVKVPIDQPDGSSSSTPTA